MPQLNVYKSSKKTIYLCGLKVFRDKVGFRISYNLGEKGRKSDIAYCKVDSDMGKFFDRILKSKSK